MSLFPSATYNDTVAGRDAARAGAARDTLLAAIGLQVAFLVPSLIAYGLDERQLAGVSVWSKPIKFELSIMLMAATIVLLLPLLDAAARATRAVRWSAGALAVAGTLEVAYILLQAARGRASHFNFQTTLESNLYKLMGVGALALVTGCFVIGWMIWRRGRVTSAKGLRLGAILGLTVGAVLTLITAGILASGTLTGGAGHWVGGARGDAGGLWLTGWSRSGGDLRVPHFFATHMMQALPLLGLTLDRLCPGKARMGVWLGTLAAVAIVAATFLQAAAGRPFL